MLKKALLSVLFLAAIGFMAMAYAPVAADDARKAQVLAVSG